MLYCNRMLSSLESINPFYNKSRVPDNSLKIHVLQAKSIALLSTVTQVSVSKFSFYMLDVSITVYSLVFSTKSSVSDSIHGSYPRYYYVS